MPNLIALHGFQNDAGGRTMSDSRLHDPFRLGMADQAPQCSAKCRIAVVPACEALWPCVDPTRLKFGDDLLVDAGEFLRGSARPRYCQLFMKFQLPVDVPIVNGNSSFSFVCCDARVYHQHTRLQRMGQQLCRSPWMLQ